MREQWMRQVLLTGHSGYLGSVMVTALQAAGYRPVGLDTGFFEGCDFADGSTRGAIPALRKDVRDVTAEHLEGYGAVIHLAALCNDPLGELNPELTLEINHKATVRLARLAKQAGVGRFLFASSCSIYGASSTDQMVNEEAPMCPLTAYGVSKIRCEEDLAKLAGDAFSPVFMRNATAYGVSPRLRGNVVLNNLVSWAVASGRVRVLSDGTPWRPLVHAEDIARAFVAVLDAPAEIIHNQAFNVGADSDNYQVRELAEIVGETVPGCSIEYAEGGGPDPRSYRVDFGKLARMLPAAVPRWNVRAGASQLYDALRRQPASVSDFREGKFNRLARFKTLLASGRLDQSLRWRVGAQAAC